MNDGYASVKDAYESEMVEEHERQEQYSITHNTAEDGLRKDDPEKSDWD